MWRGERCDDVGNPYNQPMRDLIFRTRFRWKLRPRHVTGDTKYGTIENIKALEDAGIRAYVPLPDWEHQRPYFGPAQFTGFRRA
jgi:hypothetical protein